MPIRRLSRKLNRKINADTVVEQLGSFRIDKFENRKDEVGLLYGNLTSLHDQIIQLFNDKERFAADVSHELKNPIASIIANSDNAIINAENSDNVTLPRLKLLESKQYVWTSWSRKYLKQPLSITIW